MNNRFHQIICLTGWLLSLPVAAQDNQVRATAAISIQQDQKVWAGQQVTLNLDLKTTGFSFSNTLFNLPEVSGALLMQTDTTTIKITEKIDGQSWQIVRYPLALYPQKSGRIVIPPIDVRFTTATGFGSAAKTFEFLTTPLELSVNTPPGMKEGNLLITTTSFELDHTWQPEATVAHSGDAVTLTVSRRASDISAMLLPPLPVFQTDGLAAYPQAPEVNDKTDRGDLVGERIDTIIWIIEKPGTYEIPGIRFQWWDPVGLELKQRIIQGLSLDVMPSVEGLTAEPSAKGIGQSPTNWLRTPLLLLAGFVLLGIAIHCWKKFRNSGLTNEKSSFVCLKRACMSNNAQQTHTAIYGWLACLPHAQLVKPQNLTLSSFAQVCKDQNLAKQLEQLQEALLSSSSNWQGLELLRALQKNRSSINRQNMVKSKDRLAPLNP